MDNRGRLQHDSHAGGEVRGKKHLEKDSTKLKDLIENLRLEDIENTMEPIPRPTKYQVTIK